jgi:hypothetical protein
MDRRWCQRVLDYGRLFGSIFPTGSSTSRDGHRYSATCCPCSGAKRKLADIEEYFFLAFLNAAAPFLKLFLIGREYIRLEQGKPDASRR